MTKSSGVVMLGLNPYSTGRYSVSFIFVKVRNIQLRS